MTGTTRTISQPAANGSFTVAVLTAAVIVIAALAIAWGATNLGRSTAAAVAAPPVYAPIVRDLGARDEGAAANGLALDKALDHGSSAGSGLSTGSVQVGGFGGTRLPDAPTNGSTQGAPASRHVGLRAQ